MPTSANQLMCEIELGQGEEFRLPPALLENVGPGHWLVTITPLPPTATSAPIRDHTALLNSYVVEDEGLYDDYPAR